MRNNNTLKDFISVYDNVLTKDYCKYIIETTKNADWVEQYYELNGRIVSDGMQTCFNIGSKTKLMLTQPIKNTLDTYTKTIGEELFSVKEISPIRLNKYELNARMNPHIDHQPAYRLLSKGEEFKIDSGITQDKLEKVKIYDSNAKNHVAGGIPILTLVGILNDDFVGGEFIFWDEYAPVLKTGSLLVFPSNFLYKHAINSVRQGTRYSFIVWVW